MSDRDELARMVALTTDCKRTHALDAARMILAAGWRKKPSREAVTAVVHDLMGIYTGEAEVVADAILALFDSPPVSGEGDRG